MRRRGAHELADVVDRHLAARGARAARLGPCSVASGVDGLDLEQGIDARLDVRRDRALVADEPAVIVDAAHRVLVVARAGCRAGSPAAARAATPASVSSSSGPYVPEPDSGAAGGGVERAASAFANTSPWPGSTTPQPKRPSVKRAKAIAFATGSAPGDPLRLAELARARGRRRRRSPRAGRARRSARRGCALIAARGLGRERVLARPQHRLAGLAPPSRRRASRTPGCRRARRRPPASARRPRRPAAGRSPARARPSSAPATSVVLLALGLGGCVADRGSPARRRPPARRSARSSLAAPRRSPPAARRRRRTGSARAAGGPSAGRPRSPARQSPWSTITTALGLLSSVRGGIDGARDAGGVGDRVGARRRASCSWSRRPGSRAAACPRLLLVALRAEHRLGLLAWSPAAVAAAATATGDEQSTSRRTTRTAANHATRTLAPRYPAAPVAQVCQTLKIGVQEAATTRHLDRGIV